MSSASPHPNESPETLLARLNLETARIGWSELQRHYARGQVVRVSSDLDLIQVGASLIQDDAARVGAWMQSGQVGPVVEADAHRWYTEGVFVWSLVIAPWVLVQYRDPPAQDETHS